MNEPVTRSHPCLRFPGGRKRKKIKEKKGKRNRRKIPPLATFASPRRGKLEVEEFLRCFFCSFPSPSPTPSSLHSFSRSIRAATTQRRGSVESANEPLIENAASRSRRDRALTSAIDRSMVDRSGENRETRISRSGQASRTEGTVGRPANQPASQPTSQPASQPGNRARTRPRA